MRRILCYGDSNTFGYNPHSYWGEPYPDDTRWTGILQSNGWDVANCGQNGREIPASEGELCAVERLISAAMPVDIVTVLLGSNDFLNHPHFTAEDVTARMEVLLDTSPAYRAAAVAGGGMGSAGYAHCDGIRATCAALPRLGGTFGRVVRGRGRVECGAGFRRRAFSPGRPRRVRKGPHGSPYSNPRKYCGYDLILLRKSSIIFRGERRKKKYGRSKSLFPFVIIIVFRKRLRFLIIMWVEIRPCQKLS